MLSRPRTSVSLLLVALLSSACADAAGNQAMQRAAADGRVITSPATAPPPSPSPSTSVPPSSTTVPPVATTLVPINTMPAPSTPAEPSLPTPPAPPPAPRTITEQAWTPFATVGGITLVHPATRVERVGFHQSNHDGARQLDVLGSAVSPVTMEARSRPTSDRTAADVVVDPVAEIRSPVTGRVLRSGTYVLYCDYSDDYLVVEPDQHPGWEVKLLHISGVQVGPGDRVVAGETLVAPRATQLPFQSQVDEVGGHDPAWPHVHIEVVDPAIPDQPSPGGGCD